MELKRSLEESAKVWKYVDKQVKAYEKGHGKRFTMEELNVFVIQLMNNDDWPFRKERKKCG